jgi:hypothetical protein
MSSASSVVWVTVVLAVAGGGIVAACASSTESDNPDCLYTGCVDAGGGVDSSEPVSNDSGTPVGAGGDTGTGVPPSDAKAPPDEDSGKTPPITDAGTVAWIDMTIDASACVDENGVPCGWSATNNGVGDICACRNGTWVVGWTCDRPSAPTVAGPSCPGVVTTDASVGAGEDAAVPDASIPDAGAGAPDTGGGQIVDAGGWIDMDDAASACVNEPNAPCGWSAINNGLGWVCACREGTWAVPWTCGLPDAAIVPGSACP